MSKGTVTISKRCFVRIISFSIALILTFGALSIKSASQMGDSQLRMQNNYMRAVEDLSLSLDNIKTTLNKGMYANSPAMMNKLSGKLWSEAANAKAALAQLPIQDTRLEQTYKFLSQVGNYSQSLSRKFGQGEQLTDEEIKNIKTLYGYADDLSGKMWQVEKKIEDGNITLKDISAAADNKQSVNITEGFTDFEEGFSNYPTLIYDGPFSDHILEKEPLMLKGTSDFALDMALSKAKKASGNDNLTQTGDEGGKMPSYVFENNSEKESTTVSVTKKGGLLSYMLKYRQVGKASISANQAMKKAEEYLENLGIYDLTQTYYEINNGECICNFAGEQENAKGDDVTLYTDLIKVGVALDNGEILSYDARGYITNHILRDLKEPKLSEEEAANKLSQSLNVFETNLCVIPSEGLSEKYCYEFYCSDEEGRQLLIYINADSGEEEQILLLQIGAGGRLTV